MTNRERALAGKVYLSNDPELRKMFRECRKLLRLFNNAPEEEIQTVRIPVLNHLFGSVEGQIYIEPPFRCDYGKNIHIGDNFYANFDCVILDVTEVKIGRNVMLGPKVCIFTAAHPIDGEIRATGLEYGRPVTIGDNVWIGGNAVINPGVTVGSNVVIGSGSVVTRDIPDNVIAAGNPARVLREITQTDKDYWQARKVEYEAEQN